MICPNCNTNNADTAKFCAGCGTELNETASVSFGMPQQAVEPTPIAPNPEPIPVTAPAVEPAPAAPAYEPAPAYAAPVESAPAYAAPVESAPAYAAPVESAPAYAAPVEPAPAYAAPVAPMAPDMNYGAPAPKKKSNLALILGIAGGALLAAIVAVVLIFFVFGSSPEKTIEQYYNGVATGDGMAVYESSINPYLLAGELDDYDSEQELIDEFCENIKESYEDNLEEYGYDAKLNTITILSKTEFTKDEVAKIAEYADERCGIPAESIDDVCILTVYTDFGGLLDNDTQTTDMVMGKIDGKWYVYICGPEGNITSKARIDNILGK